MRPRATFGPAEAGASPLQARSRAGQHRQLQERFPASEGRLRLPAALVARTRRSEHVRTGLMESAWRPPPSYPWWSTPIRIQQNRNAPQMRPCPGWRHLGGPLPTINVLISVVETSGLEPPTPCLQIRPIRTRANADELSRQISGSMRTSADVCEQLRMRPKCVPLRPGILQESSEGLGLGTEQCGYLRFTSEANLARLSADTKPLGPAQEPIALHRSRLKPD
jgi:hypothetical protein